MPTVPQQQRDQAKPGRTSWRRHAASWPLWGGCLEGRSGTFRQMKLPKQSSGTGEQSQVLRESGPRPPDTSQAFDSQRLGAPENPRARMPWCQGARVPQPGATERKQQQCSVDTGAHHLPARSLPLPWGLSRRRGRGPRTQSDRLLSPDMNPQEAEWRDSGKGGGGGHGVLSRVHLLGPCTAHSPICSWLTPHPVSPETPSAGPTCASVVRGPTVCFARRSQHSCWVPAESALSDADLRLPRHHPERRSKPLTTLAREA